MIFHTPADAPIITDVKVLRAAPPSTVVETGNGYRYVKKTNGRWHWEFSKNAPSSWLLDPDHSRQPLRLLYTPEGRRER